MTKTGMQKIKKLLSFFRTFELSNLRTKEQNKGFTLLELLIVIAILATLATIVVIVLNPAETLAKSRDTQRMSDLSTLKSAIALYLTTVNNPQLDGKTGTKNDKCIDGAGNQTVYLSIPSDIESAAGDVSLPTGFDTWGQMLEVNNAETDGDGWVPVDLTAVSGGAPLSNLPIDPVNDLTITTGSDISALTAITNGAQMYRYACEKTPLSFEINTRLESEEYGVGGTKDKAAKDGGNNAQLYEVGTKLDILPSLNSF